MPPNVYRLRGPAWSTCFSHETDHDSKRFRADKLCDRARVRLLYTMFFEQGGCAPGVSRNVFVLQVLGGLAEEFFQGAESGFFQIAQKDGNDAPVALGESHLSGQELSAMVIGGGF